MHNHLRMLKLTGIAIIVLVYIAATPAQSATSGIVGGTLHAAQPQP